MQFGLLGPLDVRDGDRSLVPGPAKHRALLAALLLTPNQMVPFGRLVAVLWGEQPPPSAAPVLRVYVSGLRRLLGQERIRTAPGGYLIAVGPEQVDLHRFEGLATRAQRARNAGRLDEAAELLRAALGLWRGPALADVESDELQRVEAVRIEELRLKTLEDRLDLDLERGRHREVIGELRQLVASFPLRERPWAQLMLALHRSGRRAEALEVYQRARSTLVAELGLEPGEELRELHQRLLVDDPALSGSRLPGPAAAAPPAPPRELPPDVRDFTGRQEALAWTREVVEASGSAPLHVVFYGQPGVGKTALALHAATALASRFPDGQLYADLRGAASAPVEPAAVLAGFLRSLGCPEDAVPAGFADRLGRYRSMTAGKRLLILLDNAAGEAQVRPLLPATPGCVALVTSRSPLAGLEGGQSYELDVLPAAQAVELLDRVVGQGRVQAELQAAERVVALCGQLPLAIRIAGARLARRRSWSLAHLATRLADERHRLDELQAGDLAVRGSIGFGYQSLAADERRLFRRLGLLSAPDFAAWAAAPLLGDGAATARRLVESLADASLLEPLGPDRAGQERYRLHDLTRLYARERFDEEEGDPGEVLERLALDALDAVRRAWSLLVPSEPGTGETRTQSRLAAQRLRVGTHEIRESGTWLGAERVFLVHLVADFHHAGLRAATWRLAYYLAPYFELHAHWDDWRGTHELALPAAREHGHARGEALVLRGLGDLHRLQGRPAEAEHALRSSLEGFTRLADQLEQAHTERRLGLVHLAQGRLEEAEGCLERCRATFEAAGDLRGSASALRALGAVRRRQGDLAAAEKHLEQCLAALEEVGAPRGQADALQELAGVHLEQRRLPEARRRIEGALRISRRLEDRLPEARELTTLAGVARAEGRTPSARDYAQQALEAFQALGEPRGVAGALVALGEACLDLDDVERAIAQLTRSLGMFEELGDPAGQGQALHALGEAQLRAGRLEEAAACLARSHERFTRAGARLRAVQALRTRGLALRRLGDRDGALSSWNQALTELGDLRVRQRAEIESLLAEEPS